MLFATAALAAGMETTLLVCSAGDGCEDERQWLAGMQPGLILVADPARALDAFVSSDGATTVATEVEAADYAIQDRKWRTAEAHLDRAAEALANWPGSVPNRTLVRMYTLRGVALRHQGKDGVEAAFRQASAMAWNGEPDPRGLDGGDQLALDTERRKLLASGFGTLVVDGEAQLWLDGAPLERRNVQVPAGLHRLTAVEPGKLRTFVANVPVLPDRMVLVSPAWGPVDDAAWLLAELASGIERLDAKPESLALLSDWCRRHDVERLTLAEVVPAVMTGQTPNMALSPIDPHRPAAAAGEAIPQEEGIAATFEAAVQEAADAAAQPTRPVTSWRLKVAYFDATTRRLSAEPAPIRVADTVDAHRFHLSARIGWTHQLDREHAALDAQAAYAIAGGFGVRGDVGLLVADAPYNLYADWVDAKLLHAAAAATWAGTGTIAPTAAAGAEVQAPLWTGAFAEGGAVGRFDRTWLVEATGRVSFGAAAGEPQVGWGAGVSMGRSW